ncbi:alpha-tubulin N-acetyltransferase-like isoform X1 [Euwallacea fornicatus]|uniref:alpha-tubulin N-acetyltransferase-like isoform X1 n=1 Tax=Euwallacea fornicatus TaxID=995702 RepID=UPI00338E98FC
MEFRFNLNEIFKHPIVEVGNTLVPPGFNGDKRALWDTQSKVTQIINAMGEASAHAQGLTKPITTADRLRNSEHRLYLLIDQDANNGKGAVTGMLKTGEKSLYVFDREGQHYQLSPPCVLDFYVHESRQRSGFGRQLFEHMLHKEKIEPMRMAIDRPSEKFLGFLQKHYGLSTPVKQMNNYVVFDGFFPKAAEPIRMPVEGDNSISNISAKKQSVNGLQQGRPFGRYGAPRPPCSMGQIIHNDSAVIKTNQKASGPQEPKADRPNSLNIDAAEEPFAVEDVKQKLLEEEREDVPSNEEDADSLDVIEEEIRNIESVPDSATPKGLMSPRTEAAGIVTPGRSTPGLTDQGYFDLKFYHNKLW